MSLKSFFEQVPDSAKLGMSLAPSALHVMGLTLEEWTFVLSGIVSILFIIEKLPKVIRITRDFITWIKDQKKD